MIKIDKLVIREFVLTEVKKRNVNGIIRDDELLISTGILDSLFIVDLIYFLEKKYSVNIHEDFSPRTEDINTINKIYDWVSKLSFD
jgi:acyl carrier protein